MAKIDKTLNQSWLRMVSKNALQLHYDQFQATAAKYVCFFMASYITLFFE